MCFSNQVLMIDQSWIPNVTQIRIYLGFLEGLDLHVLLSPL